MLLKAKLKGIVQQFFKPLSAVLQELNEKIETTLMSAW